MMQPTSSQFERAAALLLSLEGGYVNDPDDPGGETKYGISKRTYPDLNIEALTEQDARAIYRQDWWERYGYDTLPGSLGTVLLILAVNIGPTSTHRFLQHALLDLGYAVTADGLLGPVTRQAVDAVVHDGRLDVMIALIRSSAIERYRRLGKPKFLAGWVRRASIDV